tara:strand:- start:111 stop:524 length:414 start_codon:yes stop_codon:yes gene_type:complete
MKIQPITGKEIAKFIDLCDSMRIRRASYDYYNTAKDGDFYGVGMYINRELRGVSACDYERKYGITLLRKAYQQKGHGKTLLKHKIDHFNEKKIPYETTVAADNIPSFKMCHAVGLKVIKAEIKTRSSGEYITLTLGN